MRGRRFVVAARRGIVSILDNKKVWLTEPEDSNVGGVWARLAFCAELHDVAPGRVSLVPGPLLRSS